MEPVLLEFLFLKRMQSLFLIAWFFKDQKMCEIKITLWVNIVYIKQIVSVLCGLHHQFAISDIEYLGQPKFSYRHIWKRKREQVKLVVVIF